MESCAPTPEHLHNFHSPAFSVRVLLDGHRATDGFRGWDETLHGMAEARGAMAVLSAFQSPGWNIHVHRDHPSGWGSPL
jgi:hypothetical protein